MSLNPRQKRFAELYHRYGNGTRAYGEAGEIAKTDDGNFPQWVTVEASRLLRNPHVKEELARLRGETAALAAMTREEMADYYIAVITTPIGEIGPDSPLCEEYTVTTTESGTTIKTKCVSKIGAARELARMCGFNAAEEVKVSADSAVVDMLAGIMGSKRE